MALPAMRLPRENPVEERISRLEANVEHIQRDVTEIKGDIRRLDAKIDGLNARLDAKIDAVKDSVAALALTMEKSIASAKMWAVGLYVALVAGLATGFMWILERLPPPP